MNEGGALVNLLGQEVTRCFLHKLLQYLSHNRQGPVSSVGQISDTLKEKINKEIKNEGKIKSTPRCHKYIFCLHGKLHLSLIK